jgi:hypothetical protein
MTTNFCICSAFQLEARLVVLEIFLPERFRTSLSRADPAVTALAEYKPVSEGSHERPAAENEQQIEGDQWGYCALPRRIPSSIADILDYRRKPCVSWELSLSSAST